MGKRAFVFPGQGSQQVGMGQGAFKEWPEAREVFERAGAALNEDMAALCFNGPQERLTLTENAQPALLTVSSALYQVLASRGLAPDFVAGHSLGEYSALVAAGVISLEDGVRAVRLRGRFMQEAVPPGEGGMAALMGLSRGQVEELCAQVSSETGRVVEPANFNSPQQIVVSGHRDAVLRLMDAAKEAGCRRAVELKVSAPFHCSLMRPAQERLAGVLGEIAFSEPAFPVLPNVTAEPVSDGHTLRELLVRQVTAPVLWQSSVERMVEEGVSLFVEVGAGKVLSGLVKKTNRKVKTVAFGGPEDLESVLKTWEEHQ